MRWTLGRLSLAAAVRTLQLVSGDRDAHTKLRATMNRRREAGREAPPPLPENAFRDRRSILVCKTEQRGDVILSIPSLRALRARYPSARITVLGGPWSVEILAAVPEVNEVLVLDQPPQAFEAARAPTLAEREELVKRLAAGRFDLAVDLTGDPWTLEVLADAGIPARVGPAETGAGHLLHRSVPVPPNLHRIEGMLSVVGLLGGGGDDATPRLMPPEAARAESDRISNELGLVAPFIVVHPGGRSLKRWPVERSVELVRRLVRETGDTVVVLLGPDERDLEASFEAGSKSGRVKFWPGGSFLAVGAMVGRSRLYIGSDSGVAHLAAAVGATTLTLFGPARVSRWAPRAARGAALSTDESCAYPCWPALYAEPCSHHRCLRHIPVDRVFEQALALLNEPARAPERGSAR